MRLIDADALYERACSLEAKALDYIGKLIERDGDKVSVEWKIWSAVLTERIAFKHDVIDAPTIEPQRWIPVKFRPMDSEEREYWEEHFGEELADEDAVIFDCHMPKDGQEILVSYRKWISMDKCEIDGGCYGLQGNGDWEDVVAWMPLPEPYKEEER